MIVKVPLPAIVTKEGKLFVAWCPVLDIASQGKTYEEAIANLQEAVDLYSEDKDARKIKSVKVSMTHILASIPKGVSKHAKTTHSVRS